MRWRPALWVLLVCAFATPPAVAEPETLLVSKNTYALIVGVLVWQESGITSYPKEDRQDRALHERLRAMGVPAANMTLLLDAEATARNARSALERIAKRAQPGSTLIFYYAGHGSILHGGGLCMLPYDYDSSRPRETGLFAAEVAEAVARHFRGRRMLLMADCCYSGGLARTARALHEGGIEAASLTSATALRTSTQNWTFTQTVLSGLRGDPIVDANADGQISLAEAAGEVRLAMKFHEKQRAGFSTHGLDLDVPLAKTTRKDGRAPEAIDGPFGYRQYVTAEVGADRRTGRVLAKRGAQYEVELTDYSSRRSVLLPPGRLKAIEFERRRVGEELGILWGGRAWRGRILAVDGDFHKITYVGWSSAWDEWVLSDRFTALPARPTASTPKPVPLPPAVALMKARVGGRYAKLLRKIEVETDVGTYAAFHDYGWFDGTEWAGHKDLPPGYWVYVYPHWYIWEKTVTPK